MTEGIDIDTELLIEEVRRHPELWDVGSSKKNAAWIEVCGTLIADFESKEDAIKNTLGKTIMGRWRNVRDNYMRFQRKRTKSGQAAETGRKYVYARQLDFLMGSRENIPTEASSQAEEGDTEAVGENPVADTNEIPVPARADNPPQRRAAPAGPPRKRQIEDALMAFMQQLPAPTTAPDDDDDDRAFFNSLLPMVREFQPDQKLELRLEVLKLIQRIRAMPTPIPPRPYIHVHTAAQSTSFQPHSSLQTFAPYPAYPSTSQPYPAYPSTSQPYPAYLSTSQIPSHPLYTSTPQVSPLSPPPREHVLSPSSQSQHVLSPSSQSQHVLSPSSQSQHSSQYDFDLYSQH